MVYSRIDATNVYLALVDLVDPCTAIDVIDFLAGASGADSRYIAPAVRRQLNNLVRREWVVKINHYYILTHDDRMVMDHPKPAKNTSGTVNPISLDDIPEKIRRVNPKSSTFMSQSEWKYTQRFWKTPLYRMR